MGGNTQAELASTRHREGWYRKGTGRTQSGVLAESAGRSIKRMVQPRELRPDDYSWESPVVGQTRWGERSLKAGYTPILYVEGEGRAGREAKGERTCRGPGVRPAACGERLRSLGPEVLPFPLFSDGGKHFSSRLIPAREA